MSMQKGEEQSRPCLWDVAASDSPLSSRCPSLPPTYTVQHRAVPDLSQNPSLVSCSLSPSGLCLIWDAYYYTT